MTARLHLVSPSPLRGGGKRRAAAKGEGPARTVGLDGRAATSDHRQPEDMLAFLFAREAQLEADLAEVRRELAAQRRRYAEQHRLRIFPSFDVLRRLFAPRDPVGVGAARTRALA